MQRQYVLRCHSRGRGDAMRRGVGAVAGRMLNDESVHDMAGRRRYVYIDEQPFFVTGFHSELHISPRCLRVVTSIFISNTNTTRHV